MTIDYIYQSVYVVAGSCCRDYIIGECCYGDFVPVGVCDYIYIYDLHNVALQGMVISLQTKTYYEFQSIC